MSKDFHATNEPGTCLWCGYKLVSEYGHGPGYAGNGFFCSLRCGFRFARVLAEGGRRLKPTGSPPPQKVRVKRKPACPECDRPLLDVTQHIHNRTVLACATPGCGYHVSGTQFNADGSEMGRDDAFKPEGQ